MNNKFKFEDWLSNQDLNKKDWILVAQYGGSSENESFFTLSVIVDLNRMVSARPNDVQLIDKLVYAPEGRTYLLKKVEYSEVISQIFSDYYIPNSVIDVGDITRNQESDYEIKDFADFHITNNSLIVRPFIYMQENSRLGIRYELDQKFFLYYDAQKINDEYICIDINGDKIIIARIEKGEGWMKCYVLASYLRDYLTLTGYGLWRYHTHYRHGFPKHENLGEFEIQGDTFRYKVFIKEGTDHSLGKWNIILRGHDILLPYKNIDYKPISIRDYNHHESFIIGIDENGKEITRNCEVDRSEFFIPVYFQIGLMKHFYDNPEKYTVNPTFISADPIFAIDYGIVENYVQVWLGDLTRLPPKEQKLWKSFNIPLKERKIPKDRIKRDFGAQFTKPDNIVEDLRELKEIINKKFKEKYGFQLFKDLNSPDIYREKIIHVPFTEDWYEFNSVIESMEIVFVESLNKDMKKLLQGKIEDKILKNMKSIDLLHEFLKTMNLRQKDISKVINPFQLVHNLRSNIASHRKGSDYKQTLKKLGFDSAQKKSLIIRSIINSFIDQFNTILDILKS